jgi:hypothetical protein
MDRFYLKSFTAIALAVMTGSSKSQAMIRIVLGDQVQQG